MENNNYVPKTDIEKVGNLLMNHIGKKFAINSTAICNAVGFEAKASNIYCRIVISETSKYYGLPIIACRKGYFIAETEEEINDYLEMLETNIRGMEEKRALVLANFK